MVEEIVLREGDEFIKLGQLLKKARVVGYGSDAKMLIESGEILVNGEVELRRGRKCYPGDEIKLEDSVFKVVSP